MRRCLCIADTRVQSRTGESNGGAPVAYECLLPAMVRHWRAGWAAGSNTDPLFPFDQVAVPMRENLEKAGYRVEFSVDEGRVVGARCNELARRGAASIPPEEQLRPRMFTGRQFVWNRGASRCSPLAQRLLDK